MKDPKVKLLLVQKNSYGVCQKIRTPAIFSFDKPLLIRYKYNT